uniref:Uncharacterized protein n=1 Tax=Rhizophora mucronata TaxID=61149 RepID=A0A2P2NEK4_RHIMU
MNAQPNYLTVILIPNIPDHIWPNFFLCIKNIS